MMRTKKKRLKKLSRHLEALPIAPVVEEAAFELFRTTGELPEHQRLAAAVCKRALQRKVTGSPDEGQGDLATYIHRLVRLAPCLRSTEHEADCAPLREILFNEAINGSEVVRLAARSALKMLVAIGRDVTDPQIIDEDMQLPDFGSVGLHLLGFPECILKPPYVEQGRRLLDRFAALRDRIDRDDRQWSEDFDIAAFRFLDEGELPNDELMREAVLANAEWTWLLAHHLGRGDAEVMASFDQAAIANGADREEAIAMLGSMATKGRLLPSAALA